MISTNNKREAIVLRESKEQAAFAAILSGGNNAESNGSFWAASDSLQRAASSRNQNESPLDDHSVKPSTNRELYRSSLSCIHLSVGLRPF